LLSFGFGRLSVTRGYLTALPALELLENTERGYFREIRGIFRPTT